MEVEGIILAAGFSSRAGTFKMTLEINSKTVIERCIQGMYDACSRVIVVGGYRAKDLFPEVRKFPKAVFVYNHNFEAGMFSSVIKGAECFRGERAFFIPGDYPVIGKDVYQKMLKTEAGIVLPTHNGILGHPVLMNKDTVEKLLNIPGCGSLKQFIASQGYTTVEVPDPGILMDLDTPEDHEKIRQYAYRQTLDGYAEG